MSDKPTLALIGGFLGAGKTTLILCAGRRLQSRGKRVAIIMNDQSTELVDTGHGLARGFNTDEVTGGCFCCRFSDLIDATGRVAAFDPDVIFAEPVGSCIDLVATILRPISHDYSDSFLLAPLTVLVDPAMAEQVHERAVPAEVEYLFRNQLREADIVCTTRSDLYPTKPLFEFPVDFNLSGVTADGVDAWLNEILHPSRTVGARLLDVDYDVYAAAEAALGWLNLHAAITLSSPLSPAQLCGPLLDSLDSALTASGIGIVHLKVFDRAPSAWLQASLCRNGDEPNPRGDLLADPAINHELALNVRASGDPEELRRIALESLNNVPGSVVVRHLSAFRPAAPKPEFRFNN